MPLAIGTAAPDFSLRRKSGPDWSNVSLAEFRGKTVVLAFFPGAFTSVCTDELCTLSERFANLGSLNAQVLGISVDSAFVLEAWAEQNGIGFPLLSDFKREVVEAYDCVLSDFAGMGPSSKRVVYIVDGGGIIQYVEETASPGDLPNFDLLSEAVERVAST